MLVCYISARATYNEPTEILQGKSIGSQQWLSNYICSLYQEISHQTINSRYEVYGLCEGFFVGNKPFIV